MDIITDDLRLALKAIIIPTLCFLERYIYFCDVSRCPKTSDGRASNNGDIRFLGAGEVERDLWGAGEVERDLWGAGEVERDLFLGAWAALRLNLAVSRT